MNQPNNIHSTPESNQPTILQTFTFANVSSPAQIERRRQNNIHANMTDEQIENHRSNNIHANMTNNQIENHRFNNTHAGMSAEQVEHRQQRVVFKSIKQVWDNDNPCEHCGCIHLRSANAQQRKLCCQSGRFVNNPLYPRLFEMPMFLKELALQRSEHFSSRSSFYNNMFCIAVTGYDNGREGVGCEQINGPSCLKMNGRCYHFIPNSNNQKYGGIANFTYDGLHQVNAHGEYLNGDKPDSRVQIPFVRG